MRKLQSVFLQKDSITVFLLWSIFQLLWFFYLGIEFQLEATKYIGEADYILTHHHFSEFRYLFYVTTVFIIAGSKVLHLGLYGALFSIMLINLACYFYFYHSLKTFFHHRIPALLIIGLLLSFWPFQSWSLFLFTECLFYSFVLLLLGLLIRYRKLSASYLFKLGLVCLLLVLSRPLGILFILPVLLFIFLKLEKKQRIYFLLSWIVFLILLNFVIQIVFTTTPDWNMTRALTEDSIICDMPRADATNQLNLIHHSNQLYQLFYYVTHNFFHFIGLALVRLRYFFTMVRPYYSNFHNFYLIGYLLLFYGSLLIKFKTVVCQLPRPLNAFLFLSILLFAATVALQCDDYHNRFFLTLTPIFAIFTIAAWWPFVKKKIFSSEGRHKD